MLRQPMKTARLIFIAVVVWAAALRSVAGAAGDAGYGLVLDEHSTFLASQPVQRSMNAFTVGFWVKDNYGDNAELFVYLKNPSDDFSGTFSLNWYTQLLALEFRDEVRERFSAPIPAQGWFHIAISWAQVDRTIRLFVDFSEVGSRVLPLGYSPVNPGGVFTWTKYNGLDWIQKCQVTMDQVFLTSRALLPSEIAALASSPPEPTMLPDIVFYWTFENISTVPPFLIQSSYNGTVPARVLNSRFSMTEGLSNPPVVPVVAASQAPFLGSGYTVVKQTDATGASVSTLPGPAGTRVLTSLPAVGELYLLMQNGQKAATALQASDLPATALYGVRFEGSLNAGPRSVTYEVGAETAELIFLPNRAPSPQPSIVIYVDQDTPKSFSLVRTLFVPPPNPRREVKYNVDLDVDQVTCSVLSVPSVGLLYTGSGALIMSNLLPYSVPDCLASYFPPSFDHGPNMTSFRVRVSDAFSSSDSEFSVTIINKYYPIVPQLQTKNISENQNVRIRFPEAVNTAESFRVQTSNFIVKDRPFIQIKEWPRHGRLFQVGPDGKPGKEVVRTTPAVVPISLWVEKGINASSKYSDGAGWGVDQIEGEPNVFPNYRDDMKAWSGALANQDEWAILKFNRSLYPSRFDIYMNWFSDMVSRISGWDNQSSTWHVLWTADDNVVQTPVPSAMIVSPVICPTTFPVDTILVELAAAGGQSFVEIDAIAMTGFETPPLVNLVDIDASELIFVPDPFANGDDYFEYTINRCINYARNRDVYAQEGTVNIAINSVNQAPEITFKNIVFDMSREVSKALTFEFKLGARDVDGTPITATILQLPAVGTLRLAQTGEVLSTTSSFNAAANLTFTPPTCLRSPELVYNVTFTVRLSDGQLSTEGTVQIQVDCIGNVRRVSRGVEIFVFIICGISVAVCLVFMGLVVVWRHRHTIRTISPLFCILTLTGAVCINISPIFLTWSLHACFGWMSFFTLGITVFLGAIAAKTYRIDRIFNSTGFKVFAIPNGLLLGYVAALTAGQIVLLAVWGALFPTAVTFLPVPRETYVVQMCHSGDRWATVAGIQYAFLIPIFIFCAVFAWRVRRIPISEYKESREIFLAVYNIGFVSIIAIPLANVFWYEPTASVAVTAAGTCFATTVSVVCLFITKFLAIAQGRESRTSQGGSNTSTMRPTSGTKKTRSSNTSTKVHASRSERSHGPSGAVDQSSSSSNNDSSSSSTDDNL